MPCSTEALGRGGNKGNGAGLGRHDGKPITYQGMSVAGQRQLTLIGASAAMRAIGRPRSSPGEKGTTQSKGLPKLNVRAVTTCQKNIESDGSGTFPTSRSITREPIESRDNAGEIRPARNGTGAALP